MTQMNPNRQQQQTVTVERTTSLLDSLVETWEATRQVATPTVTVQAPATPSLLSAILESPEPVRTTTTRTTTTTVTTTVTENVTMVSWYVCDYCGKVGGSNHQCKHFGTVRMVVQACKGKL